MNMKVVIVGRNKNSIEPFLEEHGFVVDEKNFEFVVSYGGDGTLMRAEEIYPGVPKMILKDSLICKKCSTLSNEEVIEKIKIGEFVIEEMPKLRAVIDNQEIEGLNDIVIHNKDPRHAMRYRISVNGKLIHHEIIGDGIVVATPFGSTGYYRSITDSFFEVGIGLAFNNSIEQSDHMILNDDSVIELEVARGPAIVYSDNQEKIIEIDTGAIVRIEKGTRKAKIVAVRCRVCPQSNA